MRQSTLKGLTGPIKWYFRKIRLQYENLIFVTGIVHINEIKGPWKQKFIPRILGSTLKCCAPKWGGHPARHFKNNKDAYFPSKTWKPLHS